MLRAVARIFGDAVLVGVLLFGAAGTVAWPRAWMLLGAMLLVRTISAVAVYRVSPELLEERSRLPVHKDQARADRLLLLGVLATGFLGLPLFAALDVYRWHLLPAVSVTIANCGIALFVIGWAIKGAALRANSFAVTVVRLQSERAQVVADRGPYAIVRHPFYAADLFIHVGGALFLQSYAAVMGATVPIALMILRLKGEERFLERALGGYRQYESKVRYRLVPGVW